ncbi:E3 ubiquitin-protein ligase RNF115-like isoform X2 [Aricia agestis]|uniref:E3 ubiquitin-protein ligase RNF115-like isoform X2 n=1 Tax=Aricia agestis TaxID=91739 RepID=UPI001C2082F0|nr:E3 ubiquitin-protein ligase RNF115-like isoform X2 [Aricia agestis]
MADAAVERRPTLRFFCHRCLVEFESVLQDYCCPFCQGGFVEQLEANADRTSSSDDFSDADMSNIDDLTDELAPMLDDLAFLMSGGRLRNSGSGSTTSGSSTPGQGQGRRHTLMEELVWMIGGARPATGAMTAGAPFVLVSSPGDYVFGGEGLDAVVTQLLGQLEQAGPPPLPQDRLAELPSQVVNEELAATNTACSVCWDNFSLGENVSKLECDHMFHSKCITPWLQLHATCPICRRSLLPELPDTEPSNPPATGQPSEPSPPANPPPGNPSNPGNTPNIPPRRAASLLSTLLGHQIGVAPGTATRPTQQIRIAPRMVIRRGPLAVRRARSQWPPAGSSAPPPAPPAPPAPPPPSLPDYNTDLDYD